MTQNLSNTVWAFSLLPRIDMPLLTAISASAIARIAEFLPQQLANTSWAFACLSILDEPLCQSIASSAIPQLDIRTGDLDVSLGIDLRGLGWSFAFAATCSDAACARLRAKHLQIGKALDDVHRGMQFAGSPAFVEPWSD